MVFRRSRVLRQAFRRLPNGAVYYLADNTGPLVKIGTRLRLNTNTPPTTANWTPTAVADISVVVQRVGRAHLSALR